MFGLLWTIREFFGRCPICGGELNRTSHDCIEGDNYVCLRCGHKWHD